MFIVSVLFFYYWISSIKYKRRMENTGEIEFNVSERMTLFLVKTFFGKGSQRYARAKSKYENRLSLEERIKESKRQGWTFSIIALSALLCSCFTIKLIECYLND